MRTFNQLKVSTLMSVSAKPGITAKDLARNLQISIESSEMVLFRCFRQKLVERVTNPKGFKKPPFQYTINQRGLDRLLYLELKKTKET
jgi:DNA-binding MarR family transcriptional regulator